MAFSAPQPPQAIEASKIAYLQLNADLGKPAAQYLLGIMYLTGKYVDQDTQLAIESITASAEAGDEKAQKTLADLYYEGQIITRDLAQAERLYKTLVDNKSNKQDKWANFRLGFIYAGGGSGVTRDCGKALSQFNLVGDKLSLGNVSWILATCPEAQYRDGNKAESIAKALLASNKNNPIYLDNLAAAYAEQGNFKAAVETQQKAIKIIEKGNDFNAYVKRLSLYKKQQPFREH
ncbi:tetratricopeptide repeat protein [Shewanella surugensis]|uniref:Sel1 repeat family protein n=1 Tax=Shewanella surugensis TaxID=212020 RepID=A0ABT0LFT4_9GAMM|nr:sel1 repeat family protein [Shewanella surugensis]MCL1126558.1 sel1 repeat family protein [Shewanella surugensis]